MSAVLFEEGCENMQILLGKQKKKVDLGESVTYFLCHFGGFCHVSFSLFDSGYTHQFENLMMHYSDLKRSPCVTFLLPPAFVKNCMCRSLTPVLHFYRQKSCQRATVLILLKCFQSKTERLSFAHTTLLRNTFNPKLSGYLQQLQASFMRSQLVSAMLCSDHPLIILHVNENIPIFLMLQLTSSLINNAAVRANNLCYMKSSGDTRSNSPTLFPVLLEVSKCCAPISVNINQNIQVKHQSVWRTNLCKRREIVFVLQLGLITQRKQTEVRDFLTSF